MEKDIMQNIWTQYVKSNNIINKWDLFNIFNTMT